MNFIPIPTWQTGMTAAVGTACIGSSMKNIVER